MDLTESLVYGDHVPRRALIVDDDDDVREAHQDAMERHGYEVVAVGSGAEALAYLARDTPEVVLLDLHMEDGNGWEVLGALRGKARFSRTQVVVVTGSDARVQPPTRVLRKPFKFEALLEAIEARPAKGAA